MSDMFDWSLVERRRRKLKSIKRTGVVATRKIVSLRPIK